MFSWQTFFLPWHQNNNTPTLGILDFYRLVRSMSAFLVYLDSLSHQYLQYYRFKTLNSSRIADYSPVSRGAFWPMYFSWRHNYAIAITCSKIALMSSEVLQSIYPAISREFITFKRNALRYHQRLPTLSFHFEVSLTVLPIYNVTILCICGQFLAFFLSLF